MYDLSGVTILGVEGSPTKNGGTRFKVKLSNGTEPSTFDQAEATKAHQLTGQVVDVRLEQSGKYTNFVTAGPVGTLPALALPGGTAIPMGGVASPPAAGIPMSTGAPNTGGGRAKDPVIELRIVAQSSFATAADLVGSLYTGAGPEAATEAWTLTKQLSRELFDIVFAAGGDQPAQTTQPAAALPAGTPIEAPVTAAAVAEQVNQVMGGAVVTQGPSW